MDVCLADLPGCRGRGEHTHHRRLRSQGGSKGPTIRVCTNCHNAIHHRPALAYASGLLIHSWDPDDKPVNPSKWWELLRDAEHA